MIDMIVDKGLGLEKDKLVKRTLAIAPDRNRYFRDIITQFKRKFPGLKILYANNTMGDHINPDHPNVDYVIIIKGTLKSNNPKLPDRDVILIDSPFIFSDRSIAGWTIAVERGMMDQYFAYMLDRCVRMNPVRFEEYIQYMCLLSLDPSSDLYWKKPENTDHLCRDLEELCVRYNSKDERAKAQRDYSNKQAIANK